MTNLPFANVMRYPLWLLVPLALALTAPCGAQDIHPCVGGDEITYAGTPCPPGEVDKRLPRLPGYADPAQRDGASSPPTDATLDAPADGMMAPRGDDTLAAPAFRGSWT